MCFGLMPRGHLAAGVPARFLYARAAAPGKVKTVSLASCAVAAVLKNVCVCSVSWPQPLLRKGCSNLLENLNKHLIDLL